MRNSGLVYKKPVEFKLQMQIYTIEISENKFFKQILCKKLNFRKKNTSFFFFLLYYWTNFINCYKT